MNYKEFIDSCNDEELDDYANRVPASISTIKIKYYYAYQIPRPKRFESLWRQTGGKVTEQELFNHFYTQGKAA